MGKLWNEKNSPKNEATINQIYDIQIAFNNFLHPDYSTPELTWTYEGTETVHGASGAQLEFKCSRKGLKDSVSSPADAPLYYVIAQFDQLRS